MNRLGIQSLNAGAPDLRLSGDHTQRGTYTQRRRNQMAYGGIAGLDGRKAYGIGSWFQEKIKDPIKEKVVDPLIDLVTDNPMASTLVGSALLNQFGIPFTGTTGDRMGQNWLGELLGGIPGVGGDIDLVLGGPGQHGQTLGSGIGNLWNTITGQSQPGYTTGYPNTGLDTLGKQIGLTGTDGVWTGSDAGWLNTGKSTLKDWVQDAAGNWKNIVTGQIMQGAAQRLGIPLPGSNQQTGAWDTGKWGPKPEWKMPLAIGSAIGLADYATRSDDTMPAQLAIDPSRFATAEAARADEDLRFKPETQYALAAEGGRIGYSEGGDYAEWRKIYNKYKAKQIALGQEFASFEEFIDQHRVNEAQGGRIGYAGGGILNILRRLMTPEAKRFKKFNYSQGITDDYKMDITEIMEEMSEKIYGKSYSNLNKKQQMKIFDAANEERANIQSLIPEPDDFAQGGRIGAQEGGLMNLGGMEKDYRQEGGFVPIGGEEKADDVPARLSKNEFVFTADAVRAAGGGDIDAGAQVMENLMENLEAGGKVSEESQGLEGAQAMFANTQKLQNRII